MFRILVLLALATLCAAAPASAEVPVTQPLREEHAVLAGHLQEIDALVSSVCSPDEVEASSKMKLLVWMLTHHIAPHAVWEEMVLYPAVDKQVGLAAPVFTSSMRHEHDIIERQIAGLEEAVAHGSMGPHEFGRKADQLLGLIRAHFEVEEEVLYPILDASMTPEEFEAEIASKSLDH